MKFTCLSIHKLIEYLNFINIKSFYWCVVILDGVLFSMSNNKPAELNDLKIQLEITV